MSTQTDSRVTPERIMQMTWGYAPPLILEAAIKHRVFDVLDGGAKTLDEVQAWLDEALASKTRPTAIFSLNHRTSAFLLQALAERNIHIPEEMAIIGFDDFAWASTLRPSITVIQQSVEEMGRTATQLLFDQMNGAHSPSRRIEIASTLVLRESCGCKSNARTPMKQIKL